MAVMAPLLVGNPQDLDSPASREAWARFQKDLRALKERSFSSLSVDVWWGLVESVGPGNFDWRYYDKLLGLLKAEGFQWIPILSTHACGGNVGDDCNIPLPEWIWSKAEDLCYLSEAGKRNYDSVAHFADHVVMEDYRRFWTAFRDRYLSNIETTPRALEVEISLGASGELHYPAYHAHDEGHSEASYPFRGLFQGLGARANREFRDFLASEYSDINALNAVWGRDHVEFSEVSLEDEVADLSTRLDRREYLQAGAMRDLLAWYNESLLDHMGRVLREAIEVFGKEQLLAVKVPGIHWNEERHAELMNGLLDPREAHISWHSIEAGLGYAKIFAELQDIQREKGARLRIYVTAAATADAVAPFSRAESLVKAFGFLAAQVGISLGIENALAGDVYSAESLRILETHLSSRRAQSVTLLRIDDVLRSPLLMSLDRCQRLSGAPSTV